MFLENYTLDYHRSSDECLSMVFQSTMKRLHKLTSPPTLDLSSAICVYFPNQLVSRVAAMTSWQACNHRVTPTHCFGIPQFHGKFHQNPMQSAGPREFGGFNAGFLVPFWEYHH
jgi:hypothetical protein